MKEKILLPALLHDIGKFIYRGLEDNLQRNYRHQELAEEWAKKLELSNEIVTVIKRHHQLKSTDRKYEELSVTSFRGPIEQKNLIQLIDVSDNIVSGMERKTSETSEGTYITDIGMQPIFSRVALEESNKSKRDENHERIWEAKNIQLCPYPTDDKKEKNKYKSFYKNQWEAFHKDFQNIQNRLNEEMLLVLLQKYTMQIPEYTYVSDSCLPDTSLYHHLKSTAAVAWCSYKYITEEKKGNWYETDLKEVIYDMHDERFLILAGDLSGIQNFIYTISSKAALKTLRGRSFYLELLMEAVVQKIIDRLDLCNSSVIYNSGGGFYLLLPNTAKIKQNIEILKTEINDDLYRNFGLSLYITLAYRALNSRDLKGEKTGDEKNLVKIWGQLKQDLSKEKGRKWESLFIPKFDELFAPKQIIEKCGICQQPVDEGEVCGICSQMIAIGEELAEKNVLYHVHNKGHDTIELLGQYYTFIEPNNKEDIKRAYLLDNLWEISNRYNVKNFATGRYFSEKDFNKLAEMAAGIKKLGVLRMDVDYLGLIFSRGLEDNITFARLSDLSERLNLYFKYYLPKLLERENQETITRISRKRYDINLVYSGGDDLFIVGTWDSALDAAWTIYSDFKRYVGYNKDISLSAGLVIADEKYAFYKLADMAGEEEKKAKSNGRDSIGMFGHTLKWREFKSIQEKDKEVTLDDLLSIMTKALEYKDRKILLKGFSKSFLYKLEKLMEIWLDKLDSQEKYWIFPQLHYLMVKNIKPNKKGEGPDELYRPLLSVMLKESVLTKQMMPAVKIMDYLTRGGSEE